ncbi:zinc finger protein ZFPM1 isoform X2 [Ambystoma mexicanum]|uniref:zinc finger protein ZFPM1 isoform X2 n=1 Tax=Ambystoma mexicanum TaxID=8296 RepID=UPI0037E919E4
MSRRKQSNPRQIKRSLGDMEDGEGKLCEDASRMERDSLGSDLEASSEGEASSSSGSEDTESKEGAESPKAPETEEPEDIEQEEEEWNGPEDLELILLEGESKVRAKRALPKGESWGPYKGNFQSKPGSPGPAEMSTPVTLVLEDKSCWLARLPLVASEAEANSVVYRKGEEIWCRTTTAVPENELISTFLVAEPQAIPNYGVKLEPEELPYPASLHSGIQLLPQQAGMAAILATAVVNKDVFPCKDCGIWYRSERNLQAHLMYYCASRQNSRSPSVEEKPKDSYPNERICPFPQCKKSCPSASSLEIHMRSHSGERPFVCLICLSAFTTKANCERHLKVHTDPLNGTSAMNPSSTVKCSLCGFVADSLPTLQQHALVHVPQCATSTVNPGPSKVVHSPVPPPSPEPTLNRLCQEQLENGESHSPVDSPGSTSNETALEVRIKEEPDQSHCGMTHPACDQLDRRASMKSNAGSTSQSPSPPREERIKVKMEAVSPTPGSSPVPAPAHNSEQSILSTGGAVFLPQYIFGHEAAVVPQASEILAKMSELVHSRLKQGIGGVPTLYAGAPVQKGATCFECEITFNNINNYYVHKRLYCSGRHMPDDSPPSVRKLKATTAKMTTTPMPNISSQPTSATATAGCGSPRDVQAEANAPALENKLAEVKSEEANVKDTSSEGDSTSRMSDDSQSPGSSVDDQEEDPTKTVCEACNIRFSRHETYMVHKRYYCASRHDPPSRRANANRMPFVPQAVRTRKRRKLYEIHAPANPAPLPAPQLSAVSPSQVTLAQVGNLTASSSVDSLSGAARSDGLSMLPGLITVTKQAATPSPSSSPDLEGPIDLSKKPRLQVEMLPTTALASLTDYHECTACRVSFNSLESYLAHKKYYCPATAIQQQLQKMKSPRAAGVSMHGASNVTGSLDAGGENMVLGKVKAEKRLSLSPGTLSVSAKPVSLTAAYARTAEMDSVARYEGIGKGVPSPACIPAAICPYCPLNGPIKGDLIEHYKHVHGLLVAKPATGHAIQVNFMDDMSANRTQASDATESRTTGPTGRAAFSAKQPGSLCRGDTQNGKETTPVSSCNGSPLQNSTPRPLLPSSPTLPLNMSPASEAQREACLKTPTPPMHTDKSVQTPKTLLTPLPNSNHRFCRLCNIRFSSLSTFIAHKKYYCSSHAAEHVK